jgi:hypothetical protein
VHAELLPLWKRALRFSRWWVAAIVVVEALLSFDGVMRVGACADAKYDCWPFLLSMVANFPFSAVPALLVDSVSPSLPIDHGTLFAVIEFLAFTASGVLWWLALSVGVRLCLLGLQRRRRVRLT